MLKNTSRLFIKYSTWPLLIIGLMSLTPIPVYIGKFAIEKEIGSKIHVNEVTGSLVQGIKIKGISSKYIEIDEIRSGSLISKAPKNFYIHNASINTLDSTKIKVDEAVLRLNILSPSKNISLKSTSAFINDNRYRLYSFKDNNLLKFKLQNNSDLILINTVKGKITGTIQIRDLNLLSSELSGNLDSFFTVRLSNQTPLLSYQLNQSTIKHKKLSLDFSPSQMKDNRGSLSGKATIDDIEYIFKSNTSVEANQLITTTNLKTNTGESLIKLGLENHANRLKVMLFKDASSNIPELIEKTISDTTFLMLKNECLTFNSKTINGELNLLELSGNIKININDFAFNDLPISSDFNISGLASTNIDIKVRGANKYQASSKYIIHNFKINNSLYSVDVLNNESLQGALTIKDGTSHINVSSKDKLIDINLQRNSLDKSLHGKAYITFNTKALKMLPSVFTSATGKIKARVNASGSNYKLSLKSEESTLVSPHFPSKIKNIEANLTGEVAQLGIYKIQGHATTYNDEDIFFNSNITEDGVTSKFSSPSIFLSPTKTSKLTSKVHGVHSIYYSDNSSDLDILLDLDSGSVSLDSIEKTVIDELPSDIIFVQKRSSSANSSSSSSSTNTFRISATKPTFLLEGYGFSAKLKGNLDISKGNSDLYSASGMLTVDSGIYKNLGKVFNIERGSILYLPNTPLSSPIISMQLKQKTISGQDDHLSIWLYGPINKLKASFSHDQRFSFDEDSLNKQGSLIVAQMANASGKSIASQIQSTLKLDELSLESANTTSEPSESSLDKMVLSIGKQLSNKLYIRFKKDISTSESDSKSDAIALKYDLNKNLSLNFESSQKSNEVSLQFVKESK
jgi:hypothetical protein